MTTRILLLRHAITSAPHLFHGAESDVELGEEGHKQARDVARRIARLAPSAVYTSAMKRAIQTAHPIGEACGLPLQIVPELHERAMGNLSGTPWTVTAPIHEQTMRAWEAGDVHATHPSGESYQEMRDRALPAFLGLVAANPGRTIVLVAHGMVIRVLISTLIPRIGLARVRSIPIEHVGVFELVLRDSSWELDGAQLPAGQAADSSGPPSP